MKLKITLDGDNLKIELIKGKEIIDSLKTKEKFNLSKNLLLNVDKLLKRNGIPKTSIKNFFSKTKIPEFYTSGRIVKSVEKSFNFASKIK